MKYRCPVCRKIVKYPPREQSDKARFFPFCCERCRLIDLGAWFEGEYKITSRPEQCDEPSDAPLNNSINND